MKKLMIAAAVAAMTAGAYAGSCTDEPSELDCETVFTVKFSGKTASENSAITYKTVQKISGKGTLSINCDYVYETLAVKVGKEKYDLVLADGTVTKFTVFGKNLEKALDESTRKPGKTYSVESDLGVMFEGQTDASINVNQVAFGKASIYITKDKTTKHPCSDDEVIEGCVPVMTPKSYSGWFTGNFETCLDEAAYEDDCIDCMDADGITALIGGTWTAKYNKKASK